MQPFAIMMSSGDLTADRRLDWARECEARGDIRAAADLLIQAIALAPRYTAAWFLLGGIRERLGEREGAIVAYRMARECDPDDRHGATLALIRLGAQDMAELPPAYVRLLFDQYAPGFDAALTRGLSYRAPNLLRSALETACAQTGRPMRFGSVLDLGCGTGLAGEAFRSCADWLVGVDLSPGMIAQARKKVIYDRLHAGELMAFLQAEREANAQHHLIVAADVFAYFADLAPVVAAGSHVLAPGGLFAFTVETHPGGGALLQDTNRFAHGEDHVRAALGAAGLSVLALSNASARTEKKRPVPGLLVIAQVR